MRFGVQLGALLFTMVLSAADINPVPPGTPEPGPLADPVPSSSGKKRKGKEEVSGGGHYSTRGWMKNGLDDAQSQEDRQNLAAAISLVYNGVTYDDAEALTYGWTPKFVKTLTLNRMPKGLLQDGDRRQLERAAANVAGSEAKSCWTVFEFKELMFKVISKKPRESARKLFASYGVSKTHYYAVRKKLPFSDDEASAMSSGALHTAIEQIEFPPRGRPAYFSPDETKFILEAVVSQKAGGGGCPPVRTLPAPCS